MPRNRKRNARNRRSHKPANAVPAQSRPLQGIDQKSFVLNDIVPITILNPSNDEAYTVIIYADVNGYTWSVQSQSLAVVSGGSSLYGVTTKQFDTQAMFYNQYYTKGVNLDLTITSGGGVYSISPIVSIMNPESTNTGLGAGFLSEISSPQNVEIHQPYMKNTLHLDYSKWLMSMSDRAWRNTIQVGQTTGRELYPTDQTGTNVDLQMLNKLPSLKQVFQVTVPAGTFDGGPGAFVLGLLKLKTTYMFSQRRTDIQDLMESRLATIRADERQKAIASLSKQLIVDPQTSSG